MPNPGEAVRVLSGFDAPCNFERMQIDNGDVSVRRARHVCARPIGLHKNSSGTVSNFYALHFFSSGPVKNSDVGLTKARDECQLAIQCKLQPIRSLDVGGESVGDLLAGRVDECVASAAAVVRDVRSRSVESGDHFVRIGGRRGICQLLSGCQDRRQGARCLLWPGSAEHCRKEFVHQGRPFPISR